MPRTKLQSIGLIMEYDQPRTGGRPLALDNVNLSVEEGEFVTIVGPSGRGKTTFINIADGLLKPTGGKILLDVHLADRVIIFSARPGKVNDVVKIDLPRPRTLSVKREKKFLEYEDYLWNQIEGEVRKTMLADQLVHDINV